MGYFDSFEPSLVQSLMAESATKFRGPAGKLRRDMERDAQNDEDRESSIASRLEGDALRREENARAKRLEQIEGESPLQRQVRLDNQAWNPEKYGDKYRSSFVKNPLSTESAAAADEERRRKRLQMSMAESQGEI